MRSIRRVVAMVVSATVIAASCVASAQPTPSASADRLEVVVATDIAADLRFVPDRVSAPAGTDVRVVFHNASTQAHNLTFEGAVAGATRTIVEAGGSDVIDLLTPGPGRYSFVCTIHMGMSGILSVE